MQGSFKIRLKAAGTLVILAAVLGIARPAAVAVWNHPGVLLLRSQVQLMRGDAEEAARLADRAIVAAQKPVGTIATGL